MKIRNTQHCMVFKYSNKKLKCARVKMKNQSPKKSGQNFAFGTFENIKIVNNLQMFFKSIIN